MKHKPGNLARLATAIAEQDGLIGEVTTVSIGEDEFVPNPLDRTVHSAVVEAVKVSAQQLGLAGTCELS